MEAMSFGERLGKWPVAAKNYVQDLQLEMRRVTWPTWKQVRATTVVVIFAVFAFAAYFYVVDLAVAKTVTKVFDALSK